MKNVALNTAQIKKTLPHGAVKELAKRSKKSIYTVSRVINGRAFNTDVLAELETYIMEIQAIPGKINALVCEDLTN